MRINNQKNERGFQMKSNLEKARAKNVLGNGSTISEIIAFLMSVKKVVSPVEIANELSVKPKQVRNQMQKRLNLAKGQKAVVNGGIIELPNKKGFIRLTKVNKSDSKDGSINRYEFSKSIKKAWLS